MQPFAQSAFVDEDDGAPLAERFFLICGQRYIFHCRIACSSPSSAFPVGRWQVQLSLRRMRQTWSSSVSHPGPVLDEIAHPTRGPQSAGKSERLGSALECALEVAQLGRDELPWTPSASGLAQAAHSRFSKFPRPAANRLAVYARTLARPRTG